MSIIVLLILCIVQGLTEFLPVSSSGHLMLLENIFGIENNLLLLNLFLHLSTLMAVLVYYRKKVAIIIKKPFQPLTYKLLLSTTITVAMALIYKLLNLDKILDKYYGYYFLITALLLTITHIFQKKNIGIAKKNISYKNALLVGFIQGIAVLPGISRSGSTISSLILTGNDEGESAEYSFLLSIPIIIGGFFFELLNLKNFDNLFYGLPPIMFFIGFAITFLVSLLSIKLTEKFLKNNKFIFFAMYLVIIAVIVLFI